MELWEIIDSAVEEADSIAIQQRRDERMSLCGKAVSVTELPDGGRKLAFWRCKDPRCPRCNEYKGIQYKNKILSLVDAGDLLFSVTLAEKTANKLCKSVGKDNYLRFPQENYDFIIFRDTEDKDLSLSHKDIEEIDWTSIVTKKSNRIISGSLGRYDIVSPSAGYGYKSEAMDVVAYPADKVTLSIVQAASSVVAWSQPETEEEFQEYRTVFNSKLMERLMLNKCKVITVIRHSIRSDTLDTNFTRIDKTFLIN